MANKAMVEALIKAIQETASFCMSNGVTSRNKLIVKSNDEAFVSGLVDGYDDDIEEIIENIPDAPTEPIDLYATYGQTVEVPDGYTVEGVYSKFLYKFADKGINDGSFGYLFDLLGENEYCDVTEKGTIGAGVSPALYIFQFASASAPGSYTLYYLSWSSAQSPSSKPTSVSANELNSNGFFISARAGYSSGSMPTTLQDLAKTYPTGFIYYNADGERVDYFFRIQQSIWQFVNNTFSWLGDSGATQDLAYYYSYQSIQYKIHCIPVSKPKWVDIIAKYGESVTIPDGYTVESVKCANLYLFKSRSSTSGYVWIVEFDNANVYSDDKAISLIGNKVSPALSIMSITKFTNGLPDGSWLSSQTGQACLSGNYSGQVLNGYLNVNISNPFFVKFGKIYSDSGQWPNVMSSNYPFKFQRYDSQTQLVPYHFSVPSAVWKFENGVFSWLGDSTNNMDLAYYYNVESPDIRIRCVLAG